MLVGGVWCCVLFVVCGLFVVLCCLMFVIDGRLLFYDVRRS